MVGHESIPATTKMLALSLLSYPPKAMLQTANLVFLCIVVLRASFILDAPYPAPFASVKQFFSCFCPQLHISLSCPHWLPSGFFNNVKGFLDMLLYGSVCRVGTAYEV